MKSTILIQGAMEVEIKFIKDILRDIKEFNIDGYKFYKGKIKNFKVIVSETKIGTINAAIATLIGIKKFNPRYIINQGIAGGQAKDIHKGDIVIGEKCVNTNTYDTKYKKEGEGSNPFDWEITTFKSDDSKDNEENQFLNGDKYLIQKAKEIIDTDLAVHIGTLGSGDVWNKEVDRIIWLNKKLGVISADMESIGAYTVANKYNVPIIGIRAISDNALVKEEYERNISGILQKYLIKLIENIINNKE